jgi:catechol 2,3-dioxygenase-like lactoylglutathione lyase family enzyme
MHGFARRDVLLPARSSFVRSWLRTLVSGALAISLNLALGQAAIPALSGIAHAAIRVSDLARSKAFYEKLGFEEAFAVDKDGAPTEVFFKINDRQFIELYPRRESTDLVGVMHLCFESADLETLNRYYFARGLTPSPVKKAGAGNLLFTMEGPELQNLEYTQYMPGSKHTKDIGMHLGANRIAKQIAGLGIAVEDVTPAIKFYEQKLGFQPAQHPLEEGFGALDIPGGSAQQIEFVSSAAGPGFRLLLLVPDLSKAVAQLKARQLTFAKRESELSIQDPDGNTIVFVTAKL